MIALDTNVLIYACDKADPKRQKIALDLVSSASDGVLLWQVACEFIAASRKLRSQGFTAVDAWDRLADYLAIFPLIPPSAGAFTRARIFHTEDGWCSGTR
jgi:predicted nucleic acid-binding protein